MKRPPVIFFSGQRRIAIPYVIVVSVVLVLGAASAVTVLNSVLPLFLGIPPTLPVPETLQTVANVLAYFTALATMIVFMMFLLGLWETQLAARRFTSFQRLITLQELLSSQLTIAPNVAETDRDMLVKSLKQLAGHGCISSIIAPATAGDIEDGSIDRLFVITTLSAASFRRMVRSLKCDDVSRVPTGCVQQILKHAELGKGSVWLLTWD